MLEAIVLDNTERLLGQSPYIGKIESEFLHLDSSALTSTQRYFSSTPFANAYWYNQVLDCFFAATADSNTNVGLIRIEPNKWGTASAITSTDSALAFQVLCNDPSGSGHMWGVVNSTGANDGLWVRSAVLAGTWTKVVAAAAGNNQTLVIGDDDSLWYYNVAAGNWYQLNNGAAGNVQVVQPNAVGLYGHEYNKGKYNMYQTSKFGFFGKSYFGNGGTVYELIGVSSPRRRMGSAYSDFSGQRHSAAVSTSYASYVDGRKFMDWGAIHLLNKANASAGFDGACSSPSVASHVATLPWEFAEAAVPNGSQNSNFIAGMMHVSDQYMLIVLRGDAAYDTSTTYPNLQGDGYGARHSLALFNKQTYGLRHLGVLGQRYNVDYAIKTSNVGNAYNYPLIRFGRIKDGKLELYLVGRHLRDFNNTTLEVSYLYGLARCTLSLNNLDI